MGEYEFRDNLVTLATFQSATEAMMLKSRLEVDGIAAQVDGDVAATALNHIGAGLVSTRVVVRQGDLTRAREVLENIRPLSEDEALPDHGGEDYSEDLGYDTDEDYYANDWSGEDWADDEDGWEDDGWEDDDEPYSEEPHVTPPVKRAFRAAVIGAFLLPPLLTIYSLAIIFRHRLWEPAEGEDDVDWRVYASFLFHIIGLLFAWWLFGSPKSWLEN